MSDFNIHNNSQSFFYEKKNKKKKTCLEETELYKNQCPCDCKNKKNKINKKNLLKKKNNIKKKSNVMYSNERFNKNNNRVGGKNKAVKRKPNRINIKDISNKIEKVIGAERKKRPNFLKNYSSGRRT